MPRSGHADRIRPQRAFTLLELILVMFLLAIVAGFVAPQMSSFIRGRNLNFEARRLLSLTHYAQQRAVSEGVPTVPYGGQGCLRTVHRGRRCSPGGGERRSPRSMSRGGQGSQRRNR